VALIDTSKIVSVRK